VAPARDVGVAGRFGAGFYAIEEIANVLGRIRAGHRRRRAAFEATKIKSAVWRAMLAVGETTDPEYARKLWCEIDAIRDRQMLLKRKGAYA
jgi:hypothetical protein